MYPHQHIIQTFNTSNIPEDADTSSNPIMITNGLNISGLHGTFIFKNNQAGNSKYTIEFDTSYWKNTSSSETYRYDIANREYVIFEYTAIEDDINIKIDEKDLRVDTFRSSGAGGQHVNTTDSAVRITHLPTKIVVQCQNERSQHKNKETCYKMLKARLYEHAIQKREEENQKELNSKTDIGWGHQIRSYVLQPYQLVKDLRNKTENTNPLAVLDGNIDQFIEEGIKIR